MKIQTRWKGVSELMFNKFSAQGEVSLEEKLYLDSENYLVIPAANIQSFLVFAHDRASRHKRITIDWKTLEGVASNCIIPSPNNIRILHNKKEVLFKGFDGDSRFYIDTRKTGGSGGGGNQKIPPQIKSRPVLTLPWEINFNIELVPNPYIDEKELYHWCEIGGSLVGLLEGRKIGFGKFFIDEWKIL